MMLMQLFLQASGEVPFGAVDSVCTDNVIWLVLIPFACVTLFPYPHARNHILIQH